MRIKPPLGKYRKEVDEILKIGYWEYKTLTEEFNWSEVTRQIHEVPPNYTPELQTALDFFNKGESRNKIKEVVAKALEQGSQFDVKLKITTFTGKEKWVRTIGFVEYGENKVSRLFGSFHDIDGEKKRELELMAVGERFSFAIKAADIGIWELNLKTKDLYWSDKMYELYGVSKDDFMGSFETWQKRVHPKDRKRVDKELELTLEGKQAFNTTFAILKDNGLEAIILAEAIVINDKKGVPTRMIGVNKDITVKSIVEEQLKMLYKKNEDQNKYLSNFAHTMTHNLRSSSGNLVMLIDLLKSETDPGKKDMFLEMMDRSTKRLEETITQFNETISIRYGEDKELDHVNIHDAMEKSMENINALIKESGAQLHIGVPKELSLFGIQSYFESIFQNLLTNALKYSREGVDPMIKVTANHGEGITTIHFSDNGMGIDLERYGNKVFGMYKTFHGNKDAKGIGLFLTKNQTESMGGTINVESTPGQGTTFILKFKS